MEILETQIFRGANYWAPGPAIRFVLNAAGLTQLSTNMISGFCETLFTTLPTLSEHRCASGEPGEFREQVRNGTSLLHVAGHVALQLQILAGQTLNCGNTHEVDDAEDTTLLGTPHIVFRYEEAKVGIAAGK